MKIRNLALTIALAAGLGMSSYAAIGTADNVSVSGAQSSPSSGSNFTHTHDESGLSEALTDANLATVTHANGFDGSILYLAQGTTSQPYDAVLEYTWNTPLTNKLTTIALWNYSQSGKPDRSATSVDVSVDTGSGYVSLGNFVLTQNDGTTPVASDLMDVSASNLTDVVGIKLALQQDKGTTYVTGLSEAAFQFEGAINALPAIDFFVANPTTVEAGGTVTLSWSTSDATYLSIDQNVGEVTGTTSNQVIVNVETLYTLTATNSFGGTNASVTVTIAEPVPGTVIQPTAVISEEEAFNSATTTIDNTRMITAVNDGDAMTTAVLAEHEFGTTYDGSYVSTDRNGGDAGAFFDGTGTDPVNIVYDLTSGGDTSLDSILMWNYENRAASGAKAGNQLRTVEVRINTEAEGSVAFSGAATTITLKPGRDGDADPSNDMGSVNLPQVFTLGSQSGRYVQLSLTENYTGYQGITGGGDRVGFAEVRFAEGAGVVTDPIGAISIANAAPGVAISWDTSNGQLYDVQYKNNLIIDAWTTLTNVTGTGGGISVTTSVDSAETFYQVVTP